MLTARANTVLLIRNFAFITVVIIRGKKIVHTQTKGVGNRKERYGIGDALSVFPVGNVLFREGRPQLTGEFLLG